MVESTPLSGIRAVVFAYHDIGVRCLQALLDLGLDIRLLVTHQDNKSENIWFESVAELGRLNDIPVISPDEPNVEKVIQQVRATQPHFLFSFYYRCMLAQALLEVPKLGAFNMHGSLLPHYRGRVPVNWAIINGEKQAGVSLHRMVVKPDAGDLVQQQAVPILDNDTAQDVFKKMVCAAEQIILSAIPRLVDGSASETPLDLSQGSYFGGRKPQDGRIDWHRSAQDIHNLVRAVAPPYPGAFSDVQEKRLFVMGSYIRGLAARSDSVRIYWQDNKCWADCIDGKRILLSHIQVDDRRLDEATFKSIFGHNSLSLVNSAVGV